VVFVFTPMFLVAWILPMLFVDEVIFYFLPNLLIFPKIVLSNNFQMRVSSKNKLSNVNC
jgi:hypothetical protein